MYRIGHNVKNQMLSRYVISRVVSVLLVSTFISFFIWLTIWNDNRDLTHTILELTSICIGVATFSVILNIKKAENSINNVLGFGFLIVSIFDFMHTYYYKFVILNSITKGELSIRYWMLARIIEGLILVIFSYKTYSVKINKYITLTGTILITSFLLYILHLQSEWLPDLYDSNGVTETKIMLEYLVILMAILALYKVRSNLQKENIIRVKYLYLCILLIIPCEISFTLFENSGSFWVVFGHVVKIFSYYFLYKAIFQSLIYYPYEKLKDNNQVLSDILNAIPISILTYDSEKKVQFVNKKLEELSKYPKEKYIGLSDSEVLNVLRRVGDKSEGSIVKVINNRENTENIIRTYLDAEGKEVKVLIEAHKIKDGVIVLAHDIKEKQQIKNLNLQAQIILDAISVPTMIIDYMGDIVACNKSFTDLVEINYETITKISVAELNRITNFRESEDGELILSLDFNDNSGDYYIETPNGNKKEIHVNLSVITDIYNEKIGLIAVVQDRSKAKEEQLKLINQEKLALLGQMGATIVHETRNFLTTIKGNSQLIELYSDNDKIKQYAKKINSDTNEINKIISDFLNLSKPRETELEEVAFNDLIASMKSTIETSSLMNKVQVVLNLDYDERYMLCDETQIRQVILNICKNAVEAMESIVNPVLNISTGLDEYNSEVYIKISDNGKGIDRETLKKIGTPFFTTKRTGTGLGLSTCFQIIKEHKGRIEVESELGKGTSFTIIMPYIDEDLDDELDDII
ncbi:MAG: MASE3 domain-containing protein [Clostridiaceae bacterium]